MQISSTILGLTLGTLLVVMGAGFYFTFHTPVNLAQASQTSTWNYTPRDSGLSYTQRGQAHTLTYTRGTLSEASLTHDVSRLVERTEMNLENQARVLGAVLLNETIPTPTENPCGLRRPSSAWCYRLSNLGENQVELTFQPNPFDE